MGFWHRLGDAVLSAGTTARPATRQPALPAADPADSLPPSGSAEPDWHLSTISGLQLEIEYLDSKGQRSTRRVACQRLDQHGPHLYLFGWCLERGAHRRFRVDRVAGVIDPATGEVHEPGSLFLLRFAPDVVSTSALHFGLSVNRHADFIAALNVLAFLARCDGKWHALEGDAIEAFAASWWMRAEIEAPFDGEEILRRAARLGPDPETFYLSLQRCATHPVTRQILSRHVATVIDADGVHHPKELYWAREVVAALQAA